MYGIDLAAQVKAYALAMNSGGFEWGPRGIRAYGVTTAHYGNYVVDGQISFNGTAALAKWRLQQVIAIDREKVPAYRRVPQFLTWQRILAINGFMAWKRRYRLERRR